MPKLATTHCLFVLIISTSSKRKKRKKEKDLIESLIASSSSIVKMRLIGLNGSMVCSDPRSNGFRVFTLMWNPPTIYLLSTAIFLDFCPFDGQITRAPDALRNIRKTMLSVLAPKLLLALFLSSGVSPVSRHGVHKPPVTITKSSLCRLIQFLFLV